MNNVVSISAIHPRRDTLLSSISFVHAAPIRIWLTLRRFAGRLGTLALFEALLGMFSDVVRRKKSQKL